MKTIFVIIDGLTDEEFKLSNYEYMHKMSSRGNISYIQTIPEKEEVGSLNGILSLLGYKDKLPNNGRAYYEAIGNNIVLEEDDLIFRATWMAIGEDGRLIGTISNDDYKYNDEDIRYYSLGGYKGIIVYKNKKSLINKIKTIYPYEHFNSKLEESLPSIDKKMNDYVLSTNVDGKILIPWGASVVKHLEKKNEKGIVVAGASIVHGIAKEIGYDIFFDESYTSDIDTNVYKKTNDAIKLLDDYDFVLLHFNGADEAAHRRNKIEKQEFINKIDSICIKRLLDLDAKIIVSSDHGTSIYNGKHINCLQPYIEYHK